MDSEKTIRNQIINSYMGKLVHVQVDRPIGYQHGNIVYPINYGYIPGLLAGDGENQDAYILGVSVPLSEFTGQVVGAVRRKNDCEDKLVVAPAGLLFHQGEIAEKVHFQEQYFSSTIESLFRKSCGIIPFRYNGKEKEYLILLQRNHAWTFPKGHMEPGETEIETAARELFEETGLVATIQTENSVKLTYDIPPYTRKQVVLFLGEVKGRVCLQDTEIIDCRWAKASELKAYLHADTVAVCMKIL